MLLEELTRGQQVMMFSDYINRLSNIYPRERVAELSKLGALLFKRGWELSRMPLRSDIQRDPKLLDTWSPSFLLARFTAEDLAFQGKFRLTMSSYNLRASAVFPKPRYGTKLPPRPLSSISKVRISFVGPTSDGRQGVTSEVLPAGKVLADLDGTLKDILENLE